MKNLRKSAATLMLVAGCLVGISAHAKAFLITEGYYQVNQSENPSRVNDTNLGTNPSTVQSVHCPIPSDPQCAAEFDANGDLIANTLLNGTFQ